MARVLPRHEGAAAWSAHGTAGVSLREAHPLLRHAVYAGRADVPLPVATQVAVAHVVTHYIYYIRIRRFSRQSQRQSAEKRQKIFHNYWFNTGKDTKNCSLTHLFSRYFAFFEF
jgi:hypothetical protein